MKKPGTQDHIHDGASACVAGKTAEQILRTALECDILTPDTVSHFDMLIKKKEVEKVHKSPIKQGQGKDKRWWTYVPDETKKDHRYKVRTTREKDMYDYLYSFYYGESDNSDTLKSVYPDWKEYRKDTCGCMSTIYRNDLDWKKYCLNEPESAKLINTSIDKITRADIKQWAYKLIKKYNLTRKSYTNIQTIIRQIFQYLLDKEMIEKDPMSSFKIPANIFKREKKKPAETQIFFPDELEKMIEACMEKAETENDEEYLAIPLLLYTGERIGEILGLGHGDFNRNDSTITIHRSLRRQISETEDGTWKAYEYKVEEYLKKNSEARTILVPEIVFELEKEIKRIRMKKGIVYTDDLLFHVKTPHAVCGKLYRLCRDLKIFRRSPHKCRKTYISNLLNNGVDPDFVREQAGHKDIQTTLNSYVYSTTRNDEKIRQLNKILAV